MKIRNNKIILIAIFMGVFIIISLLCCIPENNLTYRIDGISSSKLTIQKTIKDNILREDYLDNTGEIAFAVDKHYATVLKELNDNGLVIREVYYDEKGNPAIHPYGYTGILYGYNDKEQNYLVTYTDYTGEPIITTLGYASIIRTFDEKGNIIKEIYEDLDGQQVLSTSGYYGCIKEYNKDGRCTQISYLDKNGKPFINSSGYATENRTFDSKGRITIVMYFDESGRPIQNIQGVYGIAYDYDDLDRKYRSTFLDDEGNIMLNSSGYAIVEKTFNEDSSIETEMYYDVNHNPVRFSHGQYGIKHVKGQTKYLDINGNEIFYLDQFLHENLFFVIFLGLLICFLGAFLSHCSKIFILILLVIYLLFIILMTLLYRNDGDSKAQLELFWCYKEFFISRSSRVYIIKNIWLFIPFGLLLYYKSSKRWMLLCPLIVSAVIELVQLVTGRGLFEFDDIISNAIGGCLGFYFGELIQVLLIKIKPKQKPIL